MKEIVGVSLGTSERDHEASLQVLDELVKVARRGTDGDFSAAAKMIERLDGRVDAMGLGGIDRYLVVKDRRYEIQDAVQLCAHARVTPVVDGSGVKNTLERRIVESLHADELIHPGQKVLMVSAMDRFGMAETFDGLGYQLTAGDLIFGSRINYPIRSGAELEELAAKLLPELTRLPFQQLYPIGPVQTAPGDARFTSYFTEADIVAGDFHFVRRYMPDDLTGKVVITNTTTARDIDLLTRAGVRLLVTTTPVLDGRSFGANVIEAALVAVTGLTWQHPDWASAVDAARLSGTRLVLNS